MMDRHGTGQQRFESAHLVALLFGHGGFDIEKGIARGTERRDFYVFSTIQAVSERPHCRYRVLIQSAGWNRVHEVGFLCRDGYL
jgi:hypothetical protein